MKSFEGQQVLSEHFSLTKLSLAMNERKHSVCGNFLYVIEFYVQICQRRFLRSSTSKISLLKVDDPDFYFKKYILRGHHETAAIFHVKKERFKLPCYWK